MMNHGCGAVGDAQRLGWAVRSSRWFGTLAIRIGPLVILALEENMLIAGLVANLKYCPLIA